MSKTFCVLPFMSLATNASGNLRVCCNVIPGTGFIRKPNGQIYNISKDDMKEAWNSEVYQTLRQQMLDGERPEMCARCFKEEDAGIKSARSGWNNTYYFIDKNLPADWHENNDIDTSKYSKQAPFDIKYVDLRLGNLCNLKCRICGRSKPNGMKAKQHPQWCQYGHTIGDVVKCEGTCGTFYHPVCVGFTDENCTMRWPSFTCMLCEGS